MCLDIKWYAFKKKAKKDIECFKFLEMDSQLNNMYRTPHMNFLVRIGDMYTSVLKRKYYSWASHKHVIEQGIHSVATLNELKQCMQHHSWIVKVKCMIPKGAYYYKGTWGDDHNRVNSYASTELIILEIVK